ncbi:uncharacterized protein LOC135155014 isoform X2 [Lytechinus pictus]|uniref:uncharacterized protein LOC135155014 isoform X2 n=1 Tax=Lytechinus pictus TaxID=7653 RepID=UPI0030B9EFC8
MGRWWALTIPRDLDLQPILQQGSKIKVTMASSLLQSMNMATGWVVIVLFVQTCFVLGTVTSVGVFFSEFKDTLGISSADIGISLGLFNAFTFGPGPVVASLYSYAWLRRPLLITGSVLAPLGLLLSSTVTNNIELAVCLSFAGLGGNILSQCLVICLDVHAHDHFHTLFGISKSGYAFGMLVSPLLAAYLMDVYGWRGAMLIMGAITSNIIPLTMMVDTTIRDKSKTEGPSDSSKWQSHSEETSFEDKDMIDGLINKCPSEVTNIVKVSESAPAVHNSGHHQRQFSEAVQPDDKEPYGTLCRHHEGSSKDIPPPATVTTSQGDNGDGSSELCSLMEISQPQTREQHQEEKNNLCRSKNNDHSSSYKTGQLPFNRVRQALKNSIYIQDKCLIVLVISNSLVAMVHGGWHSFFIPRAQSQGKSIYALNCLLYSTSIACFVSRILSGVLLGPRCISAYDLFFLFRIANVASMLADIYFSSFPVMIVTSFITSFAINEENMFMIYVSKERTPRSAFPQVFAVIQIAFGIGALFGTYLTGMLADITGSYRISFIFLLSIEGVLFFSMSPPRFIKPKFQENTQNPT